ncbi:MAG TPA: FAD-binding oxidoreductase, partial [Candidatus Limnocylindrales bacterium]|nr:FAD-binding oxidoreductase [Candidatus Limnocylindrales bacterium]
MPSVVDLLRQRVPGMRVLDQSSEMEAFRYDETAYIEAGTPLAVCFPRTTEEVQAVVGAAVETGTPIVARGAGTGLSGGAVAIDGAITVAFTQMASILEIDTANLTATVQPGVINADLNRA